MEPTRMGPTERAPLSLSVSVRTPVATPIKVYEANTTQSSHESHYISTWDIRPCGPQPLCSGTTSWIMLLRIKHSQNQSQNYKHRFPWHDTNNKTLFSLESTLASLLTNSQCWAHLSRYRPKTGSVPRQDCDDVKNCKSRTLLPWVLSVWWLPGCIQRFLYRYLD